MTSTEQLERVARELAIKIGQTAIGFLDIDGVFLDVNKATPLLAAALAACAREAGQALRESFIEAIREHPFDGYTLCKCRSEKFDIPMEELAKEYPKINRYVFEAKQRKAYAEHIAEIAGERAAGESSLGYVPEKA